MNTTFSTTGLAQTTGSMRHVFSFLRRNWGAFQDWRKRERLRTDLCGLSDRELHDIGITRGEVDYVVSNRRNSRKVPGPLSRRRQQTYRNFALPAARRMCRCTLG